jgi:predicted esterase
MGLQAGDGGAHLITFHPTGGHSSTEYFTGADTWLAFNEVQSGHTRDSANYDLVSAAYNSSPIKPVVDAEANYEDIPSGLNPANPLLDDYDVRKKTYWSLFAGAFGAAYGNDEVYRFYSGNNPDLLPWEEALNTPGAGEMRYVRRLMESRPYAGRVPDQSLIVGSTLSGSDHLQATRGADSSYAFIYSASGQDFIADLTKISGSTVNASWFNPRDGTQEWAGQYSTGGTEHFTPPSGGYGNDWVLMLDDASRSYSAPVPPVIEIKPGDSLTGSVADNAATIPYRLYEPSGVAPGQKVPLILYLHGMGERGTDNNLQTTWMSGLISNATSGPYASYILAPQIDTSMWFQSYNSSPTEAMKLTIQALQHVIQTENIDTSRIYVTGVSMGGMGVWDILRWLPNTFAAAVPMSAAADPRTAAAIKDIPVWAFQGTNDTLVPASATRAMIQALRNAGGNPKYTEIAGGGHVIWNPIYNDASHTLYPWLFSQHLSTPAGAPVQGAGSSAAALPPKPVTNPVTVTNATGAFSTVPVLVKKTDTVADVKPAAEFSDAPVASKPAPVKKK